LQAAAGLRDIGDERMEIENALGSASRETRPATAAPIRRSARMPWLLAGLMTALAAAFVWNARPVVPAEMHVEITTPPTSDTVSLAMSPDGTTIAFVGSTDGEPHVWLRWLGGATARSLAGTEHASFPFWSGDGKSVGFFAEGRVKTIDLESGSVRSVANAAFPSGGTWNRDGVILFVPNAGAPLSRVAASGGDPVPVARVEAPQQSNHRAPQFLPDGHHFLYYVMGAPEVRGVYIGDLESGATRRLLDADSAAVYCAPGHLLFVRQEKLYAQAFDPVRLSLSGNTIAVADGIAVEPVVRIAAVATSGTGSMAYRAGVPQAQRRFIWFDRAGHEIERLGDPEADNAYSPSLSPDGRRIAYYRTINGNADIWTFDVARGMLGRFTSSNANEINPIWSSDGKHIVYGVNRTGVFDIVQKAIDGSGGEQLLLKSAVNKAPLDMSPDGRFLLYRTLDSKNSFDIWALPMTGKPFPVAQSTFAEREAKFSPDGRWVAYQSDESGRFEIYVQEFPAATNKMQVSNAGGAQVRWRRDGNELFYVALDGRLMAVTIVRGPGGALDSRTPVPLFLTRIGGAVSGPQKQQYDVSLDGQRFLMNTLSQESSFPISLVLNWRPK
jgi:Tol biopolymer transport system component